MKPDKTYLLITISSVALLIVLVIQVNWILKTAKIKEELFNEKANMVLSKTTEALNKDTEACQKIGACVGNTSDTNPRIGQDEVNKIDSLFNYYMKFYNFHIDYTFEVTKPGTDKNQMGFANYIYNQPVEDEFELKLIFPDKKQFIIAEMGPLFITSVILILVVLFIFWKSTLSLMKEKKISEHTTDFLNNMTHEFKTPITNIALAGKMIAKDNQKDKIHHYSDIILEENEKLRLQVEQVLSMTALERGEIPLQKTQLDVHRLIHESLKCISLQVENVQGNVKLHLNADKYLVTGDKSHLNNALCNLFDNAIKYSGGKPEISVGTKNTDGNLTIIISDKGIGIEKEYQKKVFDKFFRVPKGDLHDVKGFGLGLAYVKKIIELHQGTINLQSDKGKGTTLTITLPNV